MEKKCDYCGKLFTKNYKDSERQWINRHYCSYTCSAKARMQSPKLLAISTKNLGRYAQKGNQSWNKNKPWSLESKKKMSETRKELFADGKISPWNKGKTLGANPQHSARMKNLYRSGKLVSYNKGKTLPEKRKGIIAQKVRTLWKDTLYRKHMSEVHIGQKAWNKGIPHSEETKNKLSLVAKGQRRSPQTEIKKGQHLSPNSEFKKGLKPWNFIEGVSPQYKRSGYLIQRWKKKIFERDKYECQFCKSKENLEAHHIKPFSIYPELRYKVSNGITVCKKCHKIQAVHKMLTRPDLIKIFKETNP